MQDRLYHDAILALARDGAHAGRLAAPSGAATVSNPLCGDRATVEVDVAAGRVRAMAHAVRGCVLCRASAAAIGAAAPGLDAPALVAARAALRAMLDGGGSPFAAPWEALAHFRPVSAHRSRHECVLLPFDAALAALAEAVRDSPRPR